MNAKLNNKTASCHLSGYLFHLKVIYLDVMLLIPTYFLNMAESRLHLFVFTSLHSAIKAQCFCLSPFLSGVPSEQAV